MKAHDLGFVPIEEIQNIFVTEITAIEEDIARNGMPLDHKIVFEWFDQLRQQLFKRSKYNIEEYLKANPIVKEAKKQERDQELSKSSRPLGWEDKVKKAREQAIAECYQSPTESR